MPPQNRFLLIRKSDQGETARWTLFVLMIGGVGVFLKFFSSLHRNVPVVGEWGIFACMIMAGGICTLGVLLHRLLFSDRTRERTLVSMILVWPVVWAVATCSIVNYEGKILGAHTLVPPKSSAHPPAKTFEWPHWLSVPHR